MYERIVDILNELNTFRRILTNQSLNIDKKQGEILIKLLTDTIKEIKPIKRDYKRHIDKQSWYVNRLLMEEWTANDLTKTCFWMWYIDYLHSLYKGHYNNKYRDQFTQDIKNDLIKTPALWEYSEDHINVYLSMALDKLTLDTLNNYWK